MFRAVKNENGVIIAMGNDENQSGFYPQEEGALGSWCSWTFEEVPTFEAIEGAELRAMRFKENTGGDGIELRSDTDVLATPQG
jgi:hypothetical protein